MKAILINAEKRIVSHETLHPTVRSFKTVFAEPQRIGRLPNGDVIWAETDRINLSTFSVGNGPRTAGFGLIVGKKDEWGDHTAPRSDIDSIRALVRFSELPPFEVETTPQEVNPAVEDFTRELKSQAPAFVRVASTLGGRSGRCWENVKTAIRLFGGERVHGWTIWERSGLFLTAEFHAVWRAPDGELIDVTPKANREKRILFSGDPIRYPPSFNFLLRPNNRRRRLYGVAPDVSSVVEKLSASRKAHETRQANKRGISLEEHLASKISPDGLETAIDRLFDVCAQIDSLVEVTFDGMTSKSPERVATLNHEKQDLHDEILRRAREALSGAENQPPSLEG